jgi:hypothetical protein
MGLKHRKTARYLAASFLLKIFRINQPHIIIASTGRVGSTILTHSITTAYINAKLSNWPPLFRSILGKIAYSFCISLDDLSHFPFPIIKTHDFYRVDKSFESSVKYIFVYGDPFESAASVYGQGLKLGEGWVARHIYHLKGDGDPGDLFKNDVLNYEKQIKSWFYDSPALILRYPDYWQQQSEISQFLGLSVRLPKFCLHAKTLDKSLYVNHQLFRRLREVASSAEEQFRNHRF